MELPGFEIGYKITKEWLEETFRDLERDIEVTDKMLGEISKKMEDWFWKYLENPLIIGVFWEDQNDALYGVIEDILE